MEQQERDLIRRQLDGFRLYAEVNHRVFEVLYAARLGFDDPMPWIAVTDPALRFPTAQVRVHVVTCKVCGTEVGSGYKYRAGFPAMDLCERDAVAELAGDIVQIEKGTLK
jgi:hypothetical protein